jgi:hypothetical protein
MGLLEPCLRELALGPRRTAAGHVGSFLLQRARLKLPRWLDARRSAEAASKRIEQCLLVTNRLSRSQLLQSLDYAGRLALAVRSPREGMHWSALGQEARADLFEGDATGAQARLTAALQQMRKRGFLLVPWRLLAHHFRRERELACALVARLQRAGAAQPVRFLAAYARLQKELVHEYAD